MYLVNMNADIENMMNKCATCSEYQEIQPHKKTIPYEVPCKTGKVVDTAMFLLKMEHFCAL